MFILNTEDNLLICENIFLLDFFFFSSRRRHTRYWRDWSSDVCSSDLQWFSWSSRFFSSFQNSNFFHRLWQYRKEIFFRERTIQMDCQQSHFFSLCYQIVNCLFSCRTNGTHSNKNSRCICCSSIFKRFILSSGFFRNFLHVVSSNIRYGSIEFILCFSCLEINIIILCSSTSYRMFWIECPISKCLNGIMIHQSFTNLIIHQFYFLNFMRGSKSVKKM